jgi:antitoxin Phd
MNTWPVQDAKARFSELLDSCLLEGPQMVTRRGFETAVLISAKEWHRLNASKKLSLKHLLLAPSFGELPIPERGKAKGRKPEILK